MASGMNFVVLKGHLPLGVGYWMKVEGLLIKPIINPFRDILITK